MISLDAIRAPIASDLEAFEGFVKSRFNSEGKLMSEMLTHTLSSRGKGLRPMVVMLTSALTSAANNRTWVAGERNCSMRTYLAAMLVEMLHTASLVHDDVIDQADTRRGRPSANALWQSRNAVVLGDYILARTMASGMESAQYDLVSHIIGSVATICEGEVLQSQHSRDMDTTRQDYLEIIYKKTASLISVSASAGAVSVIAPRGDVEQMRRFGEALGMAFQIQDDILDYSRSPIRKTCEQRPARTQDNAAADRGAGAMYARGAYAAARLSVAVRLGSGCRGLYSGRCGELGRSGSGRTYDADIHRPRRADRIPLRRFALSFGSGEPLRLRCRT